MQLSDACKTPPLHRPGRHSATSSLRSTTATASPPRRRRGPPVSPPPPPPPPPRPPSSQGAAGASRKSQQRARGSSLRKAESYRTRTQIDDESGVSKIKAARREKPQGCQMAKFNPSFPWIAPPSALAQSKERKGSDFAVQRCRAIVQKPKGPNTYNLKIWL